MEWASIFFNTPRYPWTARAGNQCPRGCWLLGSRESQTARAEEGTSQDHLPVGLKRYHPSGSPGGFIKKQRAESHSRSFRFSGFEVGHKNTHLCTAGLGTHFENHWFKWIFLSPCSVETQVMRARTLASMCLWIKVSPISSTFLIGVLSKISFEDKLL